MKRNLDEELNRIIDFAKQDDNIRALVLQGSFVNNNVTCDDFSDLDPLFFVKDLSPFIFNESWKNYFGNPISGFSDEGGLDDHKWYTRLTIFDDGFKIDFGFQSVEAAKYANEMMLYKVYLDKDGIIPNPEVQDERKFYVNKPTEEEFLSRMNAFFYDSSYVAKALARGEIFFVKYMDNELHQKIHKLLDWYLGIQYNFKVNPGLIGRYYQRYLDAFTWELLQKTYSGSSKKESAEGLLAMYKLVHYIGTFIAMKLSFKYPYNHEENMLHYCKSIIEPYLK